jgi:hypothetical protein
MDSAKPSPVRKRLLTDGPPRIDNDSGYVDLAKCATIAYSSEDPDHPVENILDKHSGAGGTRWMSARQNATEQILVEFDTPQRISRVVYEVEESKTERSQEVRIEVSCDAGRSFRQLRVQEYAFSPQGATFQREDLRLNVDGMSHLRLTIVPNKNGSGTATLTTLRLYP